MSLASWWRQRQLKRIRNKPLAESRLTDRAYPGDILRDMHTGQVFFFGLTDAHQPNMGQFNLRTGHMLKQQYAYQSAATGFRFVDFSTPKFKVLSRDKKYPQPGSLYG